MAVTTDLTSLSYWIILTSGMYDLSLILLTALLPKRNVSYAVNIEPLEQNRSIISLFRMFGKVSKHLLHNGLFTL